MAKSSKASEKAETDKVPVIKAVVTGLSGPGGSPLDGLVASGATKPGEIDGRSGVLTPPHDPKQLVEWYDMSAILPQHIDAIVTNVDSYGHKFVPAIDLESSDAPERIRHAMAAEGLDLTSLDVGDDLPEPSAAEVTKKLALLKRRAAIELNRVEAFFAACCPDYSFIDFRMRLRTDEFTTGNAYVEVLRSTTGAPSRMCLAPTINMRLLPKDSTPTTVTEKVRVSEITWESVSQDRYFRRFAEIDPSTKQVRTYFKEYGDPRVVSRMTGKYYEDIAAFNKDPDKKANDQPATEIEHFLIPFPGNAYGRPQWIGNLPAVIGSRELDEVNLGYFENKTVPPLALLVNGGRLAKGVVPRIEEFIEQQVKGKKNFHKILIIEAEGQKAGMSGTTSIVPTLKFEPLREAQQQDALFQNYDERNWDKVASSFRLPRILVGRDRAINRATSIAAIKFAEEQVFEPIRARFDEFINRRILPELGILFWRFRSNTPVTRDPEMLAQIIAALSESGIITPAEGRKYSGDVFNDKLAVLSDDWTKEPMPIRIARIKAGLLGGDNTQPAEGQGSDRLKRKRAADAAASGDPAPEDPAPEKSNGRAPAKSA